jgi:uncharacterized protein
MLTVAVLFDDDAAAIARLMRRYSTVPMSLADACLVRIVERTRNATLLTLDSDFRLYRFSYRVGAVAAVASLRAALPVRC